LLASLTASCPRGIIVFAQCEEYDDLKVAIAKYKTK
jgi:hypothetical protein